MPYVKRFRLTLRAFSETLCPEELSELAGASPDDSYRVGDPIGKIRQGRRETNYWSITLKIESGTSFSDAVHELLSQVSVDFCEQVKTRDPNAVVNVFVGLFDIEDQGTFEIRSFVSQQLSQRDLELIFDLYIEHGTDSNSM